MLFYSDLLKTNKTTDSNETCETIEEFSYEVDANIHPEVYIDYIIRVVALLFHIAYAMVLICSRKFQKRTYIYLHNVNLIGLLYCLLYCFYIGKRAPTFESLEVRRTFCYITEMCWANLRFLRSYSLLLLSVYRMIATFNLNLYRILISKLHLIFSTIAGLFLLSMLYTFTLKYLLKTTHSKIFCMDGYSDDVVILGVYFALTGLIVEFFPTTFIMFSYIKIIRKLKQNKSKLNNNISANLNSKSSIKLNSRICEIRFAQQFALMNLCILISAVLSILVSVELVLASKFPALDMKLHDLRVVLRIFFLLFESSIPVISLIFNPCIYKKLTVFRKLCSNRINFQKEQDTSSSPIAIQTHPV